MVDLPILRPRDRILRQRLDPDHRPSAAVEAVRSERPVRAQAACSTPRSGDPPRDLGDAGLPDALGPLTAAQRHAIRLTYYGAFSDREAAEILDVSVGTDTLGIRDGLRRSGKPLPRAA